MARLETTIRFVDHIGATTTTNHAVIPVTVFQGFQRVADLHGSSFQILCVYVHIEGGRLGGMGAKVNAQTPISGLETYKKGRKGKFQEKFMLRLFRTLHPSKPILAASILVFATALAGCQTAIAPVQVTRFHVYDAASKGGYAGSFVIDTPANTLDEATYQEAVLRELQRLGFTAVRDTAASDLIVKVRTGRDVMKAGASRGPVSIGVGGGSGGYGGGVGIGLGFNLGGKPKDQIITSLGVQIMSRTTGKPIWEGRAETTAKSGTPGAQPGLAAAKLAASLFANYPGESGKTVFVP